MRVHVVADLPSFGYEFQAIVRISVEPGAAERAGAALAAIDEIIGLTGVLGDCDFVAVLVARTQDQLDASIERRIAKIHGVVAIELDLFLDIVSYDANVGMLDGASSPRSDLPLLAEHTNGRFDATDVAIVNALREDGSRSNREIGRVLKLSEPTVRRRLNRMIAEKAIDVRPLIDPRTLGVGYMGWAWIESEYAHVRATAIRIAKIDGVGSVSLIARGRANLFAVISAADAPSCAAIVRSGVLRTPRVHRAHVIQATDLLKQNLLWRRLV